MGMADISFSINEDSSVALTLSAMGESPVLLEITADEVYLLMVSLGNALFEARKKQRKKQEERDLLYETRKIRKDFGDGEEAEEE
jgi:hypothetical protein